MAFPVPPRSSGGGRGRITGRLARENHAGCGTRRNLHVQLQGAGRSRQAALMGPNGLVWRVVADVMPPPGRGRTSNTRYPGSTGRSPAAPARGRHRR